MSRINFFTEEVSFTLKNKRQLREWISLVIDRENHQLESLNYIFCSDDYLFKMNEEYLGHNTYTDIITFDNSTENNSIEGDVYISVERVNDNANTQNTDATEELHRVMIHGVLHLLGYSDKTNEQKRSMRQKEDACLSLL